MGAEVPSIGILSQIIWKQRNCKQNQQIFAMKISLGENHGLGRRLVTLPHITHIMLLTIIIESDVRLFFWAWFVLFVPYLRK